MLEAAVQQRARLRAAELGCMVWRNNVGAATDSTGRLIRYGLGNDSAAMNSAIKSSDLIGIRPMLITPEWVGQVVGIFTAWECKQSDWVFRQSDERAVAQAKFHDLVRSAGGWAGFVTGDDDVNAIARF